MKKKQFKFYFHESLFVAVGGSARGSKNEKKFVRAFPRIIFNVCYAVGLVLYRFSLAAANKTKREIRLTAATLRTRLVIARQASLMRTATYFVVVAGLAYLGLSSFNLLAQGLELKNRLISMSKNASNTLLEAKTDLQNKNFDQAEAKFALAYQGFATGQQQLEQESFLLKQLMNLIPQKKDSDDLLQAASLLSSAGIDITNSYRQISSLQISPAGIQSSDGSAVHLEDISNELNGALSKLDAAGELLEQVDPSSLPAEYREKLVLAQDNFGILEKAFRSLQDIVSLGVKVLAGDKHILVLMENNNELRPTGGFIGTYGDIKVKNASITKLDISSVYDLDGQLMARIRPPFPIFAVNNRWYLRDSNWFADFPQSARTVSDFYEQEGGETPDVVIIVTPQLIQDLLGLTGPIQLSKYNVTLTADNFVEQTQVQSSVEYSKIDNRPKQILADLVPVLLQRLNALPKEQWQAALQVLQDNLNQKQLALYSRDPETEKLVSSFNWSGEIRAADRDYLSINTANLGGTKTDLFIKQSAQLKTVIADDGSITDQLTITRTNTMPVLPNTANISFIRVFVPSGSQLLENTGFDYNTTTPAQEPGYKIVPDVAEWEKSIVTDFVSGTSIGQEAGKTFYGNWLTVTGGQTRTITLTYRLPFKLASPDKFSLLLQKQIGAQNFDLHYEMGFPGRRILWQSFGPDQLDTNDFQTLVHVNGDSLMGEVVEKR